MERKEELHQVEQADVVFGCIMISVCCSICVECLYTRFCVCAIYVYICTRWSECVQMCVRLLCMKVCVLSLQPPQSDRRVATVAAAVREDGPVTWHTP